MKSILVATALLCSISSPQVTNAQVRVDVHPGTPVANESWYNTDDSYYYLPEQGVYYNVRRKVYVYPENKTWVYGRTLPERYNGYTYSRSHYIVLHDRTPFNRHDNYHKRYPESYYGPEGHGYSRDRRRVHHHSPR